MCELFGFTANTEKDISAELRTFYGHSTEHPDGWGLALFPQGQINIEKEPIPAFESTYLSHRMTVPISEKLVIAHIRKASVGSLQYANSHPFPGVDIFGKRWVFMHNGTLFEEPDQAVYAERQQGSTDSERILLRLLERINQESTAPTPERCAEILGSLMDQLGVPKNKTNCMLADGEYLWVYANHSEKLWFRQEEGAITFSTVPLTDSGWEKVPECRVLLCRDGNMQIGELHGNPYIPPTTA